MPTSADPVAACARRNVGHAYGPHLSWSMSFALSANSSALSLTSVTTSATLSLTVSTFS